jgi:hypothetical protein
MQEATMVETPVTTGVVKRGRKPLPEKDRRNVEIYYRLRQSELDALEKEALKRKTSAPLAARQIVLEHLKMMEE